MEAGQDSAAGRSAPSSWRSPRGYLIEIRRCAFGLPGALFRCVIAASSNLPSAASGNAHRTDGVTAAAASGAGSAAKTNNFWSLLGNYLEEDDTPGVPAAPERRPAPEQKRDHDSQSVPVTVPILEVKPEIPILDWGLASRETADIKPGSAGAARIMNLHGSSAESALDAAPPEEAATQNPQSDTVGAQGVSDLAFAARMFESDPQQASDKTVSAGAPGVAPAAATQASTSIQAGSESSADAATNQINEPASPAGPVQDNQLAVAATKAALPSTEDSRNPSAHAGQPEVNSVPSDAPPGAAERESTAGSAAEVREAGAARPVEPEPLPAPPVSHDVSLRLADGQNNNVDIRMSERAGEIRVTVHTPDGNLANSMRSELPDLVGKLRQTGYQAETWRPAAPPQTDGERRSGADSSPQQHSTGGRRDGRQQQQQQQQNQPRWVGEWNMSLDPGQETSI
jgi:hypothetical protein